MDGQAARGAHRVPDERSAGHDRPVPDASRGGAAGQALDGSSAADAGPVADLRSAGGACRRSDLRGLLAAGELDLPGVGGGTTAERWAVLADWGRRDLATARLVEGHTDAVAILAEAGRRARPDALYGVWAARSGGTGALLSAGPHGRVLHGTVRFCSGARSLDRALVVALDDGGASHMVDIALDDPRIAPDPDSWQTVAMAGADTLDVRFDEVPVPDDALVGGPGWYVERPGFAAGGAGVAAVWWGGAAGALDRIVTHLPAEPDAHQLAHLGELHALLRAADALLGRVAGAVDRASDMSTGVDPIVVAEVRSAVERAAREVLDRGPRMVGPAGPSRDAGLARHLADLEIYVRQHTANATTPPSAPS
jgi:alkylation response protein AidB-like acyl-CoA dehydrogenase